MQFSSLNFICFLLLLGACNQPGNDVDQSVDIEKDVDSWHERRMENLKRPTGYLSLAGLFWLKEGPNSFGSLDTNAHVFPDIAPDYIGTFYRSGEEVTVRIDDNIPVFIDGKEIKEASVHHDQTGKATQLWLNSLNWLVIKRGEKMGIRLRDTLSALRMGEVKIPRFATNPDLRMKAKVLLPNEGQKVSIMNAVDVLTDYDIQGILSFNYQDKDYTLTATDGGEGSFFMVVADQTTGVESYGGGRFLYCPPVDENGFTVVDFNKLHNPACAFTDYATCPLPPKENILPIALNAGEMTYQRSE